jgi:hypothetical protein
LEVKVCNLDDRAAEKDCRVAVFEEVDLVNIRHEWIDEPYSANQERILVNASAEA